MTEVQGAGGHKPSHAIQQPQKPKDFGRNLTEVPEVIDDMAPERMAGDQLAMAPYVNAHRRSDNTRRSWQAGSTSSTTKDANKYAIPTITNKRSVATLPHKYSR
jgi:hypothetical protein